MGGHGSERSMAVHPDRRSRNYLTIGSLAAIVAIVFAGWQFAQTQGAMQRELMELSRRTDRLESIAIAQQSGQASVQADIARIGAKVDNVDMNVQRLIQLSDQQVRDELRGRPPSP